MPFQVNNKYSAKKILDRELDDQPICFKGWKGQKEKLKTVTGWQEQVRKLVEQLISTRNEQNLTDIDS